MRSGLWAVFGAAGVVLLLVCAAGGSGGKLDATPYPGWAVAEVEDGPRGLRVIMCREGFPAWEAGLRVGDVLMRVGRQETENEKQLRAAIGEAGSAGQRDVQVQWVRQQENGHWRRMGGRMPLLSVGASVATIVQWERDDVAGVIFGRSRNLEDSQAIAVVLPEAIDDGEKVMVRLKVQRVGQARQGIRSVLIVSDEHRLNFEVKRSQHETIREEGTPRRRYVREWVHLELDAQQARQLSVIVERASATIRIVGTKAEEDRALTARERDAIFAVLRAGETRARRLR